ncbi:MAG: helix-turn-helix domain-containing protein [Clostridiales Family XIII bacterium]|jgi:AraC-like DNA-binding protein|nr:helix-turn-helix domain-containing protein [Clostridiales Family XIII bacterium]
MTEKEFSIYCYEYKQIGSCFHRDHIELLILLGGSAELTIDRNTYALPQGEIAIINAGLFHSMKSESGRCVAASVHIDLNAYKSMYHNIRGLRFIAKPAPDTDIFFILRNYLIRLSILSFYNYEFCDAEIAGLCEKTIALLYSRFIDTNNCRKASAASLKTHEKEKLFKITSVLAESIFEPGFSVSGLADRLNISRSRLSHFWNDTVKMSLRDTVSAYKFNEAARRLIETDKSIEAIARDCGIEDLKSFYTCFKRKFEITPGKFRVQLKKEAEQAQYSIVAYDSDAAGVIQDMLHRLFCPESLDFTFLKNRNVIRREREICSMIGDMCKLENPGTNVPDNLSVAFIKVDIDHGLCIRNDGLTVNWEYMLQALYKCTKLGVKAGLAVRLDGISGEEGFDAVSSLIGTVLNTVYKNCISEAEICIIADCTELWTKSVFVRQKLRERHPEVKIRILPYINGREGV